MHANAKDVDNIHTREQVASPVQCEWMKKKIFSDTLLIRSEWHSRVYRRWKLDFEAFSSSFIAAAVATAFCVYTKWRKEKVLKMYAAYSVA